MQQEFAEVREVPALEMNGVSWHAGRHTVLSDVSLAVKPGELLGLIGPNGSGKSSVLRILAGETAVLVTGDLDTRGEAELVRRYGDALRSQVLVLGHHGSKGSSSGAFVNAVSPDYAVASAGFGNPYGHPAREVQTRLSAHGAHLLRTDRQGAWLFDSGGQTLSARQWQPKRFYWQQKPFAD